MFIIVPYRAGPGSEEREEQKKVFIPHIQTLFPNATIIIAEQSLGKPFNRGALLNAAVRWIHENMKREHPHRLIFHDIDLLPDDELKHAYTQSDEPIMHIASVWKNRYDSASYFGGILSMTDDVYITINGFPNLFWGWGGEDDELRDRLHHHGFRIAKANRGTILDLENMNLHEKLHTLKEKGLKCKNKWEVRDMYRDLRKEAHSKQCNVEGLREACFSTSITYRNGNLIQIYVEI